MVSELLIVVFLEFLLITPLCILARMLIKKTVGKIDGIAVLRTLIELGRVWFSASLLAYLPLGFLILNGAIKVDTLTIVLAGGIFLNILISLIGSIESAKRADELMSHRVQRSSYPWRDIY